MSTARRRLLLNFLQRQINKALPALPPARNRQHTPEISS